MQDVNQNLHNYEFSWIEYNWTTLEQNEENKTCFLVMTGPTNPVENALKRMFKNYSKNVAVILCGNISNYDSDCFFFPSIS